MRSMGEYLRKAVRCFVWSAGLRDAIQHQNVAAYFAFKKHFFAAFEHENKGPFSQTLSFVAICKNEGAYLAEWLAYHHLVGVEKFYIYDNDSTDNTRDVLDPFIRAGWVVYTRWPGIRQQLPAYTDALHRYRLTTRWMGFIDLDEFVVPVQQETLPEVLAEYEDCYGLNAHWLTYGDNGHRTKTPGLVLERFTAHAAEPNDISKAIINPRAAFMMDNHHGCFIGSRSSVNELRVPIRTCTHKKSIEKIRINHYWGKSWEEYLEKCAKGRARSHTLLTPESGAYADHNRNEVQDLCMQKYVPRIKALLAQMQCG